MNKLIREFEKSSGLDVYGRGAKRVPWEATLERFTALIVRDCIKVANKNRTGMEIKTNTHLTADAIKKHFGVEE
jgi:hypothetical protein